MTLQREQGELYRKRGLLLESSKDQKKGEMEAVPLFGYELMRDIMLPEILGKHTTDILYWGGKSLARKFPLVSLEEMEAFFLEAGWGKLSLTDDKKDEQIFTLSGPFIERRLTLKTDVSFKMEAGFLAQQVQSQKKAVTEAADEIHKRSKTVKIIVRSDLKDKIE
ncbi:YslB family protein [Bacillus salacetis]|uniref:YslB family protein n=1 Tax=Bacillus salacetis TaxID=2315464 RepID=UPI003BA0F734